MQKLWGSAGGQCRCLCAMRCYRYPACTAPWRTAALSKPAASLPKPVYQNAYGQQPYQPPYQQQEDRPSAGFNALAFFFPIVGLILYLVWKNQKPRCAHAIGKWALIGFVANIVLTIIGIVLSVLFYSVAAPSYYDFGSYNDIVYGMSMAIHMLAH